MGEWPVAGVAEKMLQGSLSSGRLAHAYLFIGAEQAGQVDTAFHFAKGVICTSAAERPCGECTHCRRFETGNHPDVVQIQPDGQNIKIQQIRDVQKAFAFKAMESSRKVYIIHQADTMTVEAANALLKFLEEPSTPILAVLIATNRAKLLPTIISRCQIIPFHHLPVETTAQKLMDAGVPSTRARLLAHMTESYEAGKDLSDQERFAEIAMLVIQLTEEISSKRGNPLFTIQEKVLKTGWTPLEVDAFLDCLAWWFRDLAMIRLDRPEWLVYDNQLSRLQSQAVNNREEHWVRLVDIVLTTKKRLHSHANQALTLESMVLRLQGEKS